MPESAHGTNPATAAACGYAVEAIPANERGRVDLAALKAKLGPDVAALMLTNPNTCGLFEDEIIEIAEAVHEAGAFFYCDGANFNAIVGRVRPGDLGIDACTSICTRPSRRRMAAAGRAADRSCLPPNWRLMRRCRGSCIGTTAFALIEQRRWRRRAVDSAAQGRFTARWACSCARSPT